jgi:photosystem II stability/assembly factor-like uncharacterized protein
MKLIKTLLPMVTTLFGLFTLNHTVSAQIATVWQKTSAPNQTWRAIASSADGTKLVAAAFSGTVQISTNSGVTWTPTSLSISVNLGRTIAMSADGTILAVATRFAGIYVSVDAGATWTARASTPYWTGIACSTNGTKMVAVGQNTQIYTSTDSGTNWTANDSSRLWGDVASSADGTKLVAVEGGLDGSPGLIYTSTDSGATWIPRGSSQPWSAVASSADGTKLAAVDGFDSNVPSSLTGEVYTSSNSGTNWTAADTWTAPTLIWAGVASSADGNHLVIVAQHLVGGNQPAVIYTSTNAGASWQLAYAPDIGWPCVATSADGTKLAAVSVDSSFVSSIYTYAAPSTNAPALGIAVAGGNAFLSWPWPASGFVLQQNTNLATTNWVNVTNPPAVVNQVVAAPPGANNFYRLTAP